MSALPDVNLSQLGGRSRLDRLHIVVILILSVLPAAAAAAFAPSADTNQTLIALYAATLPWSVALSAIAAGLAGGWFGRDERKKVLAAAGILLVAGVVGRAIAPGASVDEHFTGGSPVVVVSEAIVFGVIGYALVYGWPMWCASFIVAAYVGWWVRAKRPREDVTLGTPALTARVVSAPLPRVSRASVAFSTGRPTLGSSVAVESPRPRQDDLAGLTKAELYQRARELGIKGRSAMSKADLLAALRGNR
jgi:MFS family permease